ncbi:rCG34315 [Rattus norvegicus]|uniref:RCG34315 n=1 Tax=Rattus norvegicus TaxID=10116 RepID=A6HH72_RAT|nr:rCG34315 [Rattus norvegicus]
MVSEVFPVFLSCLTMTSSPSSGR